MALFKLPRPPSAAHVEWFALGPRVLGWMTGASTVWFAIHSPTNRPLLFTSALMLATCMVMLLILDRVRERAEEAEYRQQRAQPQPPVGPSTQWIIRSCHRDDHPHS